MIVPSYNCHLVFLVDYMCYRCGYVSVGGCGWASGCGCNIVIRFTHPTPTLRFGFLILHYLRSNFIEKSFFYEKRPLLIKKITVKNSSVIYPGIGRCPHLSRGDTTFWARDAASLTRDVNLSTRWYISSVWWLHLSSMSVASLTEGAASPQRHVGTSPNFRIFFRKKSHPLCQKISYKKIFQKTDLRFEFIDLANLGPSSILAKIN